MRGLFAGLALLFSATIFSRPALGQTPANDAPQRVGQIFITGNPITRQDVIFRAVPLFPGQVLRLRDLRIAEKNLERLGLFTIDPVKGVRPRVSVLEGEGPFKDVLVDVQEAATSCVRVLPGLSVTGELVVSIVWEERNFDPSFWPTSLDDLTSGRAFRGAGQLLRLELLQFPVLPCRSPRILRLGSFLVPVGALRHLAETDKSRNKQIAGVDRPRE